MTDLLNDAPAVTDEAPAQLLVRLLTGGVLAAAIHVVAALGIPDVLASGAASGDELAASSGADAGALGHFLRYVAGFGIVHETPEGRFERTRLSDLLRSDRADSLAAFTGFMAEVVTPTLKEARHTAITGKPAFDKAWRSSFYEHLAGHPDHEALWNRTMSRRARRVAGAVGGAVDWTGVDRVVDVGGNEGAVLALLLTDRPELEGILYDQPHVVAGAPAHDRCEVVGGDFLLSVPEGGDLYLLANVVCNWPDPEAITILRRCRAAMADSARIVFYEPVVREGVGYHPARGFDLIHLLLFGGQARTLAEWRALLAAADLELVEPAGIDKDRSVLEARPLRVR